MKGMGVLIGVAAVAGLVLASATKGSAQQTVEIKPGETWMLTVKAVGGTLGQSDEDAMRKMASATGATIQSLVRSEDGKMMVMVVTYAQPIKLVTNQLIALTTSPDRGLVITEAAPFAAGGPQGLVPDQKPLAESTFPVTKEIVARAGETYFLRVATLGEPVPADEALMNTLFPGGGKDSAQRLNLPNGRALLTFTLRVAEDKRWPLETDIPSDDAGHGITILEALKR